MQKHKPFFYFFFLILIASVSNNVALGHTDLPKTLPPEIDEYLLPSDIKSLMLTACGDIDRNKSKIFQFIGKNPTSNLSQNEIKKQFWNMVMIKLVSNTPEFQSLNGTMTSINSIKSLTSPSCPPITSMTGSFISANKEEHGFILTYDGHNFRYMIDDIFPELKLVSANAEEFDFEFIDSETYLISYKLTNATLLDIIQNPPLDFTFVVNGTNGELYVSIPKNIPRDVADKYPIGYILLNGVEMDKEPKSNCFYDYTFPIDGETRVEFLIGYSAVGPHLVYDDLSSECIEKTTSSDMLDMINVRGEVVSVFESSIDKLIERGYLQSSTP